METSRMFWPMFCLELALQVHAQVSITDLPCIQRLNQLYCKDQGTQYPTERIDHFIELNKALTLRMFGEASPSDVTLGPSDVTLGDSSSDVSSDVQSMHTGVFPSYLQRQASRTRRAANATMAPPAAVNGTRRDRVVPSPPKIDKNSQHRVDSCESEIEIITPFWANNTNNELRVIVNTKHFPQAIQAEICTRETTSYCSGSCICEQKYTYHRLLAYDPDNDCKGIYIDWFLYPSCCACRCKP